MSFSISDEVLRELGRVERICADLQAHAGTPFAAWLAQFDTSEDQFHALALLRHLKIFSLSEVRSACRDLHGWVMAQPGVAIETTAFTSFAYGKSGALVQYMYRTSNWLHYCQNIPFCAIHDPKSADAHPKRQRQPDPETLVIMDDFVGAGTEACNYFKLLQESGAWDRYRNVFFVVFVAYDEGLRKICEGFPNLRVRAHSVRKKVFAADNRLFSPAEAARHEAFLARYQARVYPNKEQDPVRGNPRATPCGYRNGQAMVGFFYNTQSNTLPIFWSVYGGWTPLFQRYDSYSRPSDAVVRFGGYQYDAEVQREATKDRRRALVHMGCLLDKVDLGGETWRQAFERFDTNGDGMLSRDEFRFAVGCGKGEGGGLLSEEELGFVIDAYDADQSGMIDYGEFVSILDETRHGEHALRATHAPSRAGGAFWGSDFATAMVALGLALVLLSRWWQVIAVGNGGVIGGGGVTGAVECAVAAAATYFVLTRQRRPAS